MLHGRVDEMAAVDELLAAARDGRSSVLVIRGEAGIGKTALLDHAASSAGEMRIIRSSGIESESELPFAGLHLLLHQLTDRIDTLPRAQAQALRGALGLTSESGSDRFLVGLAVLTLLADLAEERPLLCLVDDAHWLDRASADALLFAARRLEAEGIALFLAARDLHAPPFPAPGLAELQLSSLDDDSSSAMLMDHASDLPRYVRDQIVSEAGGNPLALQELPVAQREGQIPAFAYNLGTLPMTKRIQQTFADRISNLPERTQTLLLIAATDDTGDPAVTLKVAERFGGAIEDLEPAEEKRLMRFADGRLTFRHPLIRAAAYQGAPLGLRLTVHRALADVLDGRTNADRRAWHLAAASTGPDEHVATALEESAEHARLRSGYVAVAAAYERAAMLSPDPWQRGRRLTAAARAAADAGQLARAVTLADQAAAYLTDPVARAQVARIRATLAREQNCPREAHRILQDAAASIASSAPDVAGDMFFDSVDAAWTALDFVAVEHTAELAEKLGLRDATQVRVLARVAGGLTLPAAGGVADGVRAVRELLAGEEQVEARDRPLALRERAMITRWSLLLGDHAAAHDWAVATERDCRAQGAIGVLPVALSALAITQLHLGRHHDALATGMEGLRIAEETGQSQSVGYLSDVMAHLAAIQGEEQLCGTLVSDAIERGMAPAYHVRAMCALSLLDLGLGRYEAALGRLADAVAGPNPLAALGGLPDLVEAAVRVGQSERAREPAEWYQTWAVHTGQPWAKAVALRCRAMLGGDGSAQQDYAQAVRLHQEDGGRPFERARTELLYGEWLRRARSQTDARQQLRSACEMFERLGAAPWTDRARTELRATGERRPEQDPVSDLLNRLTPQELQVVRLAAKGLSNRDIGAQMFLSPRTVGYHLYKAYPKLGVTSRNELAALDLTA